MGCLAPWHWLVERQETHSFGERGAEKKRKLQSRRETTWHTERGSASLTMTLWDDRLTGDVWWCVGCGYKGDLDRGISIIPPLCCLFFGGEEVPENLPVGMMTFLPSASAPHTFPASGCPVICLLRLPPPPPPPPPVFSALWCQWVCHTAVKANATQAPDHISASHERPLILHPPHPPLPPPFPLFQADQAWPRKYTFDADQ